MLFQANYWYTKLDPSFLGQDNLDLSTPEPF